MAPVPMDGAARRDLHAGGTGLLHAHAAAARPAAPRPMVVETRIGGSVVDRRELVPGQWQTVHIPVRKRSDPFRRIDLRVAGMDGHAEAGTTHPR